MFSIRVNILFLGGGAIRNSYRCFLFLESMIVSPYPKLFFYEMFILILCISVMFDSLSWSFTSKSFFTNVLNYLQLQVSNIWNLYDTKVLWSQLTLLSSNPAQARCTRYIMWSSLSVTCANSVVFSGKTDRHDITKIVALNPITLTHTQAYARTHLY
jgi:hypothetical protein